MTDIAAALGIHQLARCDEFYERRKTIAERYTAAFADVPEIVTPTVEAHSQHAWHLYVIQVDIDRLRIDRNEFIRSLNERGIGTSVHYTPLHMHPLYRERFGYSPEDLPVAAALYDRIISLPIHPKMSDEDIENVASTAIRIAEENRR